jgi:hypothetical protein
MEPIRDMSESVAYHQAAAGPTRDILAPTPVVLQHAAHHHRRSASLAGRSESVPGSDRRVRLEQRSGKLARHLSLRVQSFGNLACDVAAWPYGFCFVHIWLPKTGK